MATTDSSPTGHPTTREQRGLELYRRGGIERVARDLYIVPSRTKRRVEYLVDLAGESCECRDHNRTGGPCLHVYAAMLHQAWLRRAARTIAAAVFIDDEGRS
jgi:hypothetical protein